MPIVGTAGHVDHGKSTLVEALTGRDPDRWAEEKERGLTIDLGFAWVRLDDDTEVGFVDVPGHERFIKNMLAGVGALDVALFVVAADEGWMPQTEEHLAVLDLLDVRHGVIAITRTDLVDDDLVELAMLDVDEHITGTCLEHWPVVPVSAVTGSGLDRLRSALVDALEEAGPPADSERPRLWVDRSFVISGAGVVVTGTLTGGRLSKDSDIVISPGDRRARIRGIQSHEHDVEVAAPGSRTAINLVGVDIDDVPRGALLSSPDTVAPSQKLLVDLALVRSADTALGNRGAYHLHAGTGAWPVEVRIVEGSDIETSGAALISLPVPLSFEIGDRVILREVGRQAVVAGGRVIDPAPRGKLTDVAATVAALVAVVDATPGERATALLAVRRTELASVLAAHTGGGRPAAAIVAGALLVDPAQASALTDSAEQLVEQYQVRNPLRPGMPKAELASALDIDLALLDALVAAADQLADAGPVIRTSDFTGGWGDAQEAEWSRAEQLLRSGGLAVPRASQLELDRETYHALLRDGRLVRIDDDLVYLPDQLDTITAGLSELEDGFTVSEFRDAFGLSRRHAVPILEWLDASGWTSRRGDVRSIRPRPEPGSSDAPTP
ncbi:MAG: selenocysteine-specific translation elongation factor [Acidimicrobiia bacterium]|nr:selenocysteine-specific translation elongation factor [Acidimicrobiia bacterium]